MTRTTHRRLSRRLMFGIAVVFLIAARSVFGQPLPSETPRAATAPALAGHVLWSVHLPDQTATPLDAGIRDWDVVNVIAISSADPRVMYVAGSMTAADGTSLNRRAKSSDGGQTWAVMTDPYASLPVRQIVTDPLDSDVAYFVSAEPGQTTTSGCLAKTVDRGASVFPIALPQGNCLVSSLLLIDGATGALYADGRKSTDGGASWTYLLGGYRDFLALDSQQTPRIYARRPTIAGGFVRGTGDDMNWQQFSETDHFVAVDPSNPQTLYAADAGGGLKQSTDDGASWSVVLTSPQSGGYGFGSGSVHPSSSNDVIVWGSTPNGWGLWHSSDSGATWAALNLNPAAFAWDPANSSRLVVGTQMTSAVHVTALTASAALPATFGTTITWTTTASGGTAPLEYQFWRRDPDGWHMVQDYGPSATYSWTTTSADLGQHALQVWVRSEGSIAAYEDYRAYGVFAISGATVTSLSSYSTFPAPAGYPVTWMATATGGVAPLFYKFWLYCASTGTWAVAQDWNVATGFTMTPMAADTCAVQVWVRSSGSTAAYEDWRSSGYFTITPIAPVTVTSLVSNVPPPFLEGVAIRWTAVATGGVAPLSYAFFLHRSSTRSWVLLRDFSPSNEVTYIPYTDTTQAIQVWVKSANATDPWAARTSDDFAITLQRKVTINWLSPTPWYPLATGVPVTWTASTSYGVAPIYYQFWVNQGGTWSMLRDYTTDNSVSWTPPVPGTYAVQVWVRSSGSTASYDAYETSGVFNVTGPVPVTLTSFVCNPWPLIAGTPATWSATATGGTAPLEYEFWRLDGDVWSMVQPYSTTAIYTWTPGAGDVGTQHAVQVWVRSAESSAAYEAWSTSGLFTIAGP